MLSHTIYRRHRAQRDAITRTRTNRTNQPNTRKSTSLLLQGNRGGETETRAEPNQPESQQKANWQIAPNTTPNHPPPSPTINIPTQSSAISVHKTGEVPKYCFYFLQCIFTINIYYLIICNYLQKKIPLIIDKKFPYSQYAILIIYNESIDNNNKRIIFFSYPYN